MIITMCDVIIATGTLQSSTNQSACISNYQWEQLHKCKIILSYSASVTHKEYTLGLWKRKDNNYALFNQSKVQNMQRKLKTPK